jgi:hypothetical protein
LNLLLFIFVNTDKAPDAAVYHSRPGTASGGKVKGSASSAIA